MHHDLHALRNVIGDEGWRAVEIGKHGWRVVEFFEDAGISGAKGRDKRPGLDRLLKAVDLTARAWFFGFMGNTPNATLQAPNDLGAPAGWWKERANFAPLTP